MSGAYKLRDQVVHINDLRAFKRAFVVQPLLGAAAGSFLLIVLASGIVTVRGDEDWTVVGAVAFVAGFSEPFLLGVVGRIAAVAEEKPEAPVQAARVVVAGTTLATESPQAGGTPNDQDRRDGEPGAVTDARAGGPASSAAGRRAPPTLRAWA